MSSAESLAEAARLEEAARAALILAARGFERRHFEARARSYRRKARVLRAAEAR